MRPVSEQDLTARARIRDVALTQFTEHGVKGATIRGIAEGNLANPEFVAKVRSTAPPLMRYLGRALVDGSPGAAAMFDELVAVTEESLAREGADSDHRGRATVLVAMKLGITVLNEHVSRALGVDVFSPQGAVRTGKAQLDLIRPEFIGQEQFDQARKGVARYEEQL